MRNAFWATVALAAIVAAALALGQTQARTQAQSNEPPQLVFQTPADGDVVNELPFFIQICFADPINIRDLPDGGDFDFSLIAPDNFGLGLRIVFQIDGYGASIYPGPPPGETIGDWIFTWRVTSPDGEEASEGEINYTVDPDGDPTPQSTPPACIGVQGTAAAPSETPAATTASPEPTGDATATPDSGEEPDGDGDDDSNVLLIVLIAIGAVGIALVIGFFVRRGRRKSDEPPAGEPSDDL